MLVCVPLTAAFKFAHCAQNHLHLGGAKRSGLGRLYIEGSKPYACESKIDIRKYLSQSQASTSDLDVSVTQSNDGRSDTETQPDTNLTTDGLFETSATSCLPQAKKQSSQQARREGNI